eukprot:TRINITY_DN10890_c0_g3_i2.p1 TRINITY_DN10890_c0_g3~~TRINITY_DN10890_c0_g3_i2.p1  ORF type:complete len:260 (-),score=31.92 TRINITY_DN10890_c0_g3_i2:108-842(-)
MCIRDRLIDALTLPEDSSVVQVARRTFLSGGSNPCVNTVSEFVEDNATLIPKAPMKYAKNHHRAQAIHSKAFVTTGGFDTFQVFYCEEYSVTRSEWRDLPSLNRARSNTATAFLNNRFLYAIGGSNTNSEIEMLDFNEKKAWIPVVFTNELAFNNSPAAFPISDHEIIILCGGNTASSGIFNTRNNTVKNFPLGNIVDHYMYNAVSIIDKKAYIISYNGNIHFYDIEEKKYIEHPYSNLYTPKD